MDLLKQSALAWKEIADYRYQLTYGYKRRLYLINLTFSLEDYPHLAGFQYMKDLSLPNYTSARIVERIIEEKISFQQIQRASQYENLIKPRLKALIYLKKCLDNEFTLYSYMPQMYPFYTSIKADYIISSHGEFNSFVFIIQVDSHDQGNCEFLCCSLFQQGNRNYALNQRPRAILKKERLHIPSNSSVILFDKLSLQNPRF